MNDMQMVGDRGCYLDDNNVISFQVGNSPSQQMENHQTDNSTGISPIRWLSVNGFNICSRGHNNKQCEEIELDFKRNRLIPRLISKQVNMLYGKGPKVYLEELEEGKPKRTWVENKDVTTWLESWESNGLEMNYKDFGLAIIKRYYFFRDFFVKWRMSVGKQLGYTPVAGLELVENKYCRLATRKPDVVTDIVTYNDLKHIAMGNFNYGAATFKIYPRFNIKDINSYRYACISHHKESSIGDHYGCNETHEGTKHWIKGANEGPEYINSFLKNSLAAKVHVIIPAAWIASKRKQIEGLCKENQDRVKNQQDCLLYNGIEIGTKFKESSVVKYMSSELRKLSKYLSGKNNQGKAYASISFKTGNGNDEERWKIETIDLKYKEYISSLIEYDKRADEVLLAAVGLDASISSVSKDGVISKSGSDVYYNFLLYLMTLTPDDEKCCEPFNLALQVNFPSLYKKGYRIGYYREVPTRQEDVSPNDRLNNQQS